jgi:hypothetical protein
MLQEAMQIPAKVTMLEVGVGVGLALVLVDKVIVWVQKLKQINGYAKKTALTEEAFCREMMGVAKIHDAMASTLAAQTLVLDRIYQSQATHLSALEKIIDRLNKTGK